MRYPYIGIDKEIAKLPQVKFVNGDTAIDDELELFVMHLLFPVFYLIALIVSII